MSYPFLQGKVSIQKGRNSLKNNNKVSSDRERNSQQNNIKRNTTAKAYICILDCIPVHSFIFHIFRFTRNLHVLKWTWVDINCKLTPLLLTVMTLLIN